MVEGELFQIFNLNILLTYLIGVFYFINQMVIIFQRAK
jgi:hypothetical protein